MKDHSKLRKQFNVPDTHTIKQVNYSAKGHLAQDEHWEYEEYDESEQLVAKYEEWSDTNIKTLKTDSGLRKTWAKD